MDLARWSVRACAAAAPSANQSDPALCLRGGILLPLLRASAPSWFSPLPPRDRYAGAAGAGFQGRPGPSRSRTSSARLLLKSSILFIQLAAVGSDGLDADLDDPRHFLGALAFASVACTSRRSLVESYSEDRFSCSAGHPHVIVPISPAMRGRDNSSWRRGRISSASSS